MLLGGRAAETLVFEEVSTGDDDDLAKVTDIARSVGVRYGIDTELHNVPSRRAPIVLSITELPTSRCASTARRRSARSTGPFEDWWTRRDSAREKILDGNRNLLNESADTVAGARDARRGRAEGVSDAHLVGLAAGAVGPPTPLTAITAILPAR